VRFALCIARCVAFDAAMPCVSCACTLGAVSSLFLFLLSLSLCLFPSVTAGLPYPPRSRSRSALPVKVSAFHGHRDHARPTHSRGCEISDLRERCWTDRRRRVSVWALACAGDSRERGIVRVFAAAAAARLRSGSRSRNGSLSLFFSLSLFLSLSLSLTLSLSIYLSIHATIA